MSRDLEFWVLKPVGKKYRPNGIYEDIELTEVPRVEDTLSDRDKPYFIQLQKRSIYTSFRDTIEYAAKRYGFDPKDPISTTSRSWGHGLTIHAPNGVFEINEDEMKTLERPHVNTATYANVIRHYTVDYYGSVAEKFFRNGYVRINDAAVKKATELLTQAGFSESVSDLEDMLDGGMPSYETRFIMSLSIVNRIAKHLGGVAFGNYI